MRYVIYARVSPKGSTWAATETSIGTQVDMCRQYVVGHGGEVAGVVKDEFYSAKDTKRPGLQTVLSELRHGSPEWDAIIVYKLDRLTRSLSDAAPLFDLLREKNKGFVSIHEQMDMSTPVGRAFMYILTVFAQLEREQTGQRTKDKMVSIARGGGWPVGWCPFGYVRSEKHNNVLAIEPREAAIVRDLYHRYADGQSLEQIAEVYKGQVARNSIINTILRNRVYVGKIMYDGQEYEGKHEAILSNDLFDAVQVRLPGKRAAPRPNAQSRPFLLTGLLYCKCGHAMAPYSTYNRHGTQYWYYRCVDRMTCRGKHVPAEKIEQHVMAAIRDMPIDTEGIRVMVDTIREQRDTARAESVPELKQVDHALDKAQAELRQVEGVFMAGGVTKGNMAHWNGKLSALNDEIERLKVRRDELRALLSVDLGRFEDAEQVVQGLRDISETLAKAGDNPTVQRAFLVARINRIEQGEKDGQPGFWIKLNYSDTERFDQMPWLASQPGCYQTFLPWPAPRGAAVAA